MALAMRQIDSREESPLSSKSRPVIRRRRITRISPETCAGRMRKIMNIGKKISALILALGGLVASSPHSLPAEPWPQWRGPSAATPIIRNDRVFVSSVDQQAGTLQAICLDRANGKALWQRETGVGIK